MISDRKIIDRNQLCAALALLAGGHERPAMDRLSKLLGTDPAGPEALHVIGNLAGCLGQTGIGIELVGRAIRLDPGQAQYYRSLGNMFQSAGQTADALVCMQKALALEPDSVELNLDAARIFHSSRNPDAARACFDRILGSQPDERRALVGMGHLHKEDGNPAAAETLYARALRLQPDAALESRTALLQPVVCDAIDQIDAFRRRIRTQLDALSARKIVLDDPFSQVGTTGFHLAYHGRNNRSLQRQIASFYLDACPDLGRDLTRGRLPRATSQILRVGFISRFFRRHTIGYINAGIIRHLDRRRFHVTVFHLDGAQDDQTRKIDAAADTTVSLPQQLEQARNIIADRSLDLLFYPEIGMDPFCYFLAFARLAPVQCVTWGHPDTTGIPHMDYYISNRLAEPDNARRHYSEKLVLLNHFSMVCEKPVMPSTALTRAELGLPPDGRLYLCGQSLFKFHPDFDALLRRILQKDPGGYLIVFEGKRPNLRKVLFNRFRRTLPDVLDRIQVHPRVPASRFLTLLQLADAVLDTTHFSGGYTSLLSFACGVPVVTLPGRFMRGRLTYGLYRQMDLMGCVAEDPDDYVAIALRLANDRSFRLALGRAIKERSRCLFNNVAAVRELEQFFFSAVRNRQCGGRSRV